MVRDLISNNIHVAQVYDMNSINGVFFPTPESATFQLGYGKIDVNKTLSPHIHKRVKREIEM